MPLLAVLARPAAAQAAKSGEAFPFPVHEKTLPNGLRVFVVSYDSPGLVAYYSIVRTGSRNEVEAG
ncbi:MAG TPA: insulinase family protein, partial [Polyangia bacterium]|nr:insulinase family protein [Polyangia bacterium]